MPINGFLSLIVSPIRLRWHPVILTVIGIPMIKFPFGTQVLRARNSMLQKHHLYILSKSFRSTSDPTILLSVIKKHLCCTSDTKTKNDNDDGVDDPLPEKLVETVQMRVVHDMIVCVMVLFVAFAVHVSTAFSTLQVKTGCFPHRSLGLLSCINWENIYLTVTVISSSGSEQLV